MNLRIVKETKYAGTFFHEIQATTAVTLTYLNNTTPRNNTHVVLRITVNRARRARKGHAMKNTTKSLQDDLKRKHSYPSILSIYPNERTKRIYAITSDTHLTK